MPLITPWQAQTSSFNHLLLLDLRQHQDISFGEFGPIGGIGSKPELPSPRGPARPIVSSPVPLPSTENEIASSLELDAEPFRPWLANLWRTEINLIWITTNFVRPKQYSTGYYSWRRPCHLIFPVRPMTKAPNPRSSPYTFYKLKLLCTRSQLLDGLHAKNPQQSRNLHRGC